MTRASDVLDRARQWIGTAEQPLGSNHVPGITDWYGIGNGAWCAMFVSRVFSDAGLPLPATISRGFAYCPSGVNWFKTRNRWKVTYPEAGDVVFFQWPGESRSSHVGIVESVNGDGSINTIEGNTNKQGSAEGLYVMRQTRRSYILGYGIPDYDGVIIPHIPSGNGLGVDGVFGSDTIRALQNRLNDVGANPRLVIDGDFGPATRRMLQARLNATNGPVSIDGAIGPQTIKALQRHIGSGVDGVWGSDTTRRLQMALNSGTF